MKLNHISVHSVLNEPFAAKTCDGELQQMINTDGYECVRCGWTLTGIAIMQLRRQDDAIQV